MPVAYCAYCKTRILPNNQKCPSCGSTRFIEDAPSSAPEPQVEYRTVYLEKPVYRTVYVEQPVVRTVSPKSWGVALALCLLGGGWGLHRFYVGKAGSGVMFLLTFGWFGLGWLIDLITIASGNFRDRDGLPLTR